MVRHVRDRLGLARICSGMSAIGWAWHRIRSGMFASGRAWHRICFSSSAFMTRAMNLNPTLKAMKHPMPDRLTRNVTFVRVTVVAAWISSVLAMLSIVALILSLIS